MKYVLVLLLLALAGSAVSAASIFLQRQAAVAATAPTEVSLPWLILSAAGMVATIAWRCRAANPHG